MDFDMNFILYGFGLGFRKCYGYGFEFIWIWTFDMDLDMFGLGHRFGYASVSIHQSPLKIGTFYGIIINFSLENGLGFHLDLELDLL